MNLKDIRAKYPQYNDLSDEQLGKALHAKFYSDMPYEQFASKVGIKAGKAEPEKKALPAVVDYNPGVGLVEGALSLGSGAVATAASGVAGLAQGMANTSRYGREGDMSAADRVRQVQEALTYRPRTAAGRGVVETVAMPFEALAQGADAAGGAVTDVAGKVLPPEAAAATGAAVNTAIQAAPMALTPAARAVPGESAAAIAARQKAQALNAPQDAAVAAAREAGVKLTPQEAGGGVISRGVAGLSGEPKLAKLASKKNAPTINDMIRRDVGLPDDTPLSRDALAAIRKEEGANYEAVKSAGKIKTDAKYQADLQGITKSFDTAAKDFAHRSENPFQKTMDGLRVKEMDAASLVEEVKLLRNDADKAFRAGDKQLGKAYKDAAKALDDQLDRHLKQSGDPALADAVSKYQAARQRIAKTYAAEKALNETTGNIDAAVYAAERRKGVPLTGEAKKVADIASAFPRSTQRTERLGATGPTYFDAMLGGGAGIMGTMLGGAPGAAALALGASRPAARSALLSGPVQNAMTAPRSYGQPGMRTLQDILREIGSEAGAVGVAAGQ